MDKIIDLLNMGGNGAMIAFAFLIWRLDRRVIRIELLFEQIMMKRNHNHATNER